jgi:glucose-6-phosphate 1-dehydrogenase
MSSSSTQARQEAVSGAMVVFGASGDLARRKLFPALYALEKQGRFARDFEVIGFGRTPMTDQEFGARAEDALRQHAGLSPDEETWQRFARRLHYHEGRYDDLDSLRALKDRVKKVGDQGDCGCLLYYPAVPPQVSENLLGRGGRTWLTDRAVSAEAG